MGARSRGTTNPDDEPTGDQVNLRRILESLEGPHGLHTKFGRLDEKYNAHEKHDAEWQAAMTKRLDEQVAQQQQQASARSDWKQVVLALIGVLGALVTGTAVGYQVVSPGSAVANDAAAEAHP
jgi:hypothetical protein